MKANPITLAINQPESAAATVRIKHRAAIEMDVTIQGMAQIEGFQRLTELTSIAKWFPPLR